mmetsp:Transcript_18976/g.71835  ORF Transcript_18976/g.71835 Transcript_18976/m.71835 type:complete len:237 (+) Transcript_18976:119-829(+)
MSAHFQQNELLPAYGCRPVCYDVLQLSPIHSMQVHVLAPVHTGDCPDLVQQSYLPGFLGCILPPIVGGEEVRHAQVPFFVAIHRDANAARSNFQHHLKILKGRSRLCGRARGRGSLPFGGLMLAMRRDLRIAGIFATRSFHELEQRLLGSFRALRIICRLLLRWGSCGAACLAVRVQLIDGVLPYRCRARSAMASRGSFCACCAAWTVLEVDQNALGDLVLHHPLAAAPAGRIVGP